MRILILDSYPVIHQGLKGILEGPFPGSIFGSAYRSQDVLDFVSREGWHLVILSIGQPGRGGFDVLKSIRTKRPSLPVIIFSSYSEDQYAIRAFKGGASGYVSKNSAPETLIDAIRKVVSGSKYVSPELAEHLAGALDRDQFRPPHELLSDREYEVLCMIASGAATTAIAQQLSLSAKTVSTYRTRILEKLQLKSYFELIHYTIDHGLNGH